MIYCRDEKKMAEYARMIQKGFAVVVGSGTYLRSPTHLDDLLAIFELILNGNRFTNKVYEVGSPEPLTMDDIVKTLAQALDKKARLIHLPLPVAKLFFSLKGGLDIEQLATMELDRVSDLQRLRQDFAYMPRTFARGVESFKQA
jgi:nucleoside-diphosphate-sugar epimerase